MRFTGLFVAVLLFTGCSTLNAIEELARANTPPLVPVTASRAVEASITPPTTAPTDVESALAKLQVITGKDLDAALAIAVAHNDQLAMACFPVLKKYLGAPAVPGTTDQIVGVFSVYEKARTLRLGIEKGGGLSVPVDLKLACAALLQNEREFILRLAAIAGGAMVGLPGVGAILPK